MQAMTVWLKVSGVTLNVGGDPTKGQPPTMTMKLDKPQVIIDQDKNTITIVETK